MRKLEITNDELKELLLKKEAIISGELADLNKRKDEIEEEYRAMAVKLEEVKQPVRLIMKKLRGELVSEGTLNQYEDFTQIEVVDGKLEASIVDMLEDYRIQLEDKINESYGE